MTDEELEISVAYHTIDLQLLISEKDRRAAEKAHKRANPTVALRSNGSVTITETTVKKTTTVKQPSTSKAAKKLEQAQSLIEQLQASGYSLDELSKLLGGS